MFTCKLHMISRTECDDMYMYIYIYTYILLKLHMYQMIGPLKQRTPHKLDGSRRCLQRCLDMSSVCAHEQY